MKPKRIIFLDRDGVINKNPIYLDYIKKPSEFKFIPNARKAIKLLTDAGFDVVIISNQTGIGKGLFTKKNLDDINKKMIKGVELSGGRIKKAYYCIHHPDSGCCCRKPKTGMFKKAVGRTRIDHKDSFYIGDTERDTKAGRKFGLKTIAVLSGYASRQDIKKWEVKPHFIAEDLLKAVERVVLKKLSQALKQY